MWASCLLHLGLDKIFRWVGQMAVRSMRNEGRGEEGALPVCTPTRLTSSLKGTEGTVGSSQCMSSLSRAHRHNTRLSTSQAWGPAMVLTAQRRGGKQIPFILSPLGIPPAWPQRVEPSAMIRAKGRVPGAILGQGLRTGGVGKLTKAALAPGGIISSRDQ